MPIEELPIFTYYDKQRFEQFGSQDCANWYLVPASNTKRGVAMYPAMGRKHINFFNQNRLVYDEEPRIIFKTINYLYIVVGTRVIQVDRFYNEVVLGYVSLGTQIWYDWLAVTNSSGGALTNVVYVMLTDEKNIYVIKEQASGATMEQVTDTNAPSNPYFVVAFGNRFIVSSQDSTQWSLTQLYMGGLSGTAANYFTVNGAPLNNQASSFIRQLAALHNQLYIFTDFTTDVWANIPSFVTSAGATSEFPFKLNTSYNWDYGIADPFSLSVDFGRMVWLGKNSNGLVAFFTSSGSQPQEISTEAVNVLLQNSSMSGELSPYLVGTSNGFLYQYENTIFYRVVSGAVASTQSVDIQDSANALEYNFRSKTWARVIELDGERNRIQRHVFFNNQHLVTVTGDPAIYIMDGRTYYNELRNTAQSDPQASDAFTKYPFRYELVTKQLFMPDYAQFSDQYVEIDFVFGDQTFYKSNAPFANTVFVVDEASTDAVPIYLVTEDDDFIVMDDGNTPSFDDNHYYALFKPYVELYYSDDGGVSFTQADVREFSPLGQYRWRMRWYQLGSSRNRCYKLICVSSAPIVILGGVRNTKRVSGGEN